MATDPTLQELIDRGPTGLTPWSVEQAAGLGEYTYRALVFLPPEEHTEAVRLALNVALVVHLGASGKVVDAALTEATDTVLAALGMDVVSVAGVEDAFGAGIITYREAVARERSEAAS